MSISLRRFILVMLGTLGGLAAWPLVELMLRYQEFFPGYFTFSLAQGIVFGAVLGLFFGSGEGLTSRETGKILRGGLTGLVAGTIGGALGFTVGQGVLFLILRSTTASFHTHRMLLVPVARIVGWIILGTVVGTSEGIRARSLKKSLVGATGGFLGGLLGGSAIEYLGTVFPTVIYSRLAGMLIFGLFTGLFFALIERGASPGTLRVLNGSAKGKEYGLAQNRLSLGTDARNDIVLTGYRGISGRHAEFFVKKKSVFLRPAESTKELLVNEQPVHGEHLLKYEDVIQAGTAKILFKTAQ